MRTRFGFALTAITLLVPAAALALEQRPPVLIGPPPSWYLGVAAQVLAALGHLLPWM